MPQRLQCCQLPIQKAGPLSGRYMRCVRKAFDGTSEESLCIDESAEGSYSYDVTIQMRRD